jgi:hypothetical protein
MVRRALHPEKGERTGYVIEGKEVRLVKARALQGHEGPIVAGFLDLLASDMEACPDRLKPFPTELIARAKELTMGVEIDHETPIDGVTAL